MTYTVNYRPEALKTPPQARPSVSKIILKWIDKNLVDCENPRIHGKALKGNLKGIWKYRVDDYRVFAHIQDNVLLILIIDVEHRSTAYNRDSLSFSLGSY